MVSNCDPYTGEACAFIDWVKINEQFQGKHFFPEVILNIFDLYQATELHLECTDDKLPMYMHLGAVRYEVSDFTFNNIMVLKKEDFINARA